MDSGKSRIVVYGETECMNTSVTTSESRVLCSEHLQKNKKKRKNTDLFYFVLVFTMCI